MNGVSPDPGAERIAALEGPEDARLLYFRFHRTKEMIPATSNRVATTPMTAFAITLTCDGSDGMFVVVVLKFMFCAGILRHNEVSQAYMTSLKRTLEPTEQTLHLVQD